MTDYDLMRWFKRICCKIDTLTAIVEANYSAQSFTAVIGDPGEPVAGNTITFPILIGKTILGVFIDGPAVQDYGFNDTTGELDFTARGGIGDQSVITVIYR